MLKPMDADRLALGPLWYIAFLISITCHEAAHALAAKLGGDPTAHEGGQVTLNPLPHIRREPFGTVLMPLLTFFMSGFMMGWASAPYDPYWRQRHPKRAAWMSLAGPAANFAIAILAAVLIHAGLAAGLFGIPRGGDLFTHLVGGQGIWEGAAILLSISFTLNLLLGCFNLLPFPPLDGFSALGILTPERLALRLFQWEAQLGAMAYLGLFIAWRVFDYVFAPVFFTALRLFGFLG